MHRWPASQRARHNAPALSMYPKYVHIEEAAAHNAEEKIFSDQTAHLRVGVELIRQPSNQKMVKKRFLSASSSCTGKFFYYFFCAYLRSFFFKS